jgi:hypothetical protein
MWNDMIVGNSEKIPARFNGGAEENDKSLFD